MRRKETLEEWKQRVGYQSWDEKLMPLARKLSDLEEQVRDVEGGDADWVDYEDDHIGVILNNLSIEIDNVLLKLRELGYERNERGFLVDCITGEEWWY